MIARKRAELEKLLAQEEGTYEDSSILKRLETRLRKTNRALRSARTIVDGVQKKDGVGYVTSPIDEKIAKTEQRLEAQRETKARAEAHVAKLPFDVEKLEALIAAAKADEDIEFPKDLTPLTRDEDRTDEEHEANHVAEQIENAGN
jgi:hypothetical protein